jgi:hypothetical protein
VTATATRLLVSVRDAAEARAALDGGADIIDAKDPASGPLGPVALDTLGAIIDVATPLRPVSAALGDLAVSAAEPTLESRAHAVADLGLAFVKVGLGGMHDVREATARARLVQQGLNIEGAPKLVIAGYADASAAAGCSVADILAIAKGAGAGGVMLDTADKDAQGSTLFSHIAPAALAQWVADVHAAGLFVALAGSLGLEDVARVRATGADIMGVRGAACDDGRTGTISLSRVRALVTAMRPAAPTRP